MHRRLAVRGQVQGVGFRPWVWQQATSLGLVGWVRDTGSGVEIDVLGEPAPLDALQERLWQAPSPARVERVEVIPVRAGDESLPAEPAPQAKPSDIQRSVEGTVARAAFVGTDLGVCSRCLAEVLEPSNRRWRHPFANCPQCGPRYTLTRSLPFDRAHTSMARFAMCPACEAECSDSSDRRYRHQTNGCPACGPRLWLRLPDGSMDTQDPIASVVRLLRGGAIVAVKGQGGFQLYCDASQPAAVSRLRHRKGRECRPLAVMMANVASVKCWAHVGAHEERWLQSPERPMVLLRQLERAQAELPELAPGLMHLGVMLPCMPAHYLLFHEACGRPGDAAWLEEPHDLLLAMSSGNAPGSPLVTDNDTAVLELAEMADAWLMHDRDILARNDDSILRVREDGTACFLRRGRGHAPVPLEMPGIAHGQTTASDLDDGGAPSVLALGGMLKATLCVTQGERALVSPHIGDLDNIDTRLTYTRQADLWPAWLSTQPDALACDMHPDYFSTILAAHLSHTQACASSSSAPLPVIHVQHHHAHIAAVLAERPERKEALGPVIGLAIDGHGLGSDGQVWGCELLRVHGGDAQRCGHLLPLPQPGGDSGTREPWRMAAAVLHALGRAQEITPRFGRHPQAETLQGWLTRPRAHTAHSTSLGRLFDAAAGLLDVLTPRLATDYDAEAAMRLEALAIQAWPASPLPDGWHIDEDLVLDWRPLMTWLAAETQPGTKAAARATTAKLAAVFHATLAEALAEWVQRACRLHGVRIAVLGGGCMANALIDEGVHGRLRAAGLTVWRANHHPCGDGALSLGQAWVARLRLRRPEAS